MHYAFDTWMDREFPGCPFERYADDIVAHCDTEDQARVLWAAIAQRLGTLGLELHPEKTKIVYCKDANRLGNFEHTSFDFLGYTFRGRLARGPRGYFTGFSPAMSTKAKKAKGRQIRAWHLNRRSGRTCPASPRKSTPRCAAGSTITEPSTAPSCSSSHGASTSTWAGGPCRSSSDSGQVRQSDGLAEKVSSDSRPLRPLAARPVHFRPDCGGRMTGDCHVRS